MFLGFNNLQGVKKEKEETQFKDKEGVDYSWWFSPQYVV